MNPSRCLLRHSRRVLLALLLVHASVAGAATTTWSGSGDGVDWFDPGNWDNGLPSNGTEVAIGSGTVLLTNPTPDLASLTMTAGSLTFSNWTTELTATNVTITGGTVTLPPAFTEAQMSNRVWFAASASFTLGSGATILADGKGFTTQNGPGKPPGTQSIAGGAGYGGLGAESDITYQVGGPTYGSSSAPLAPGSGGGRAAAGGLGGGAVLIQGGTVTINGTITANGSDPLGGISAYGGGGSGGGISISCSTFGGAATGLLMVNGGRGGTGGSGNAGGGGGGRIALVYTTLASGTAVRCSAAAGTSLSAYKAGIGTVYLSSAGLFTPGMDRILSGQILIPGVTSWAVSSLTLTNGAIEFGDVAFALTVTNNLTVRNGASLGVGRLSGPGTTNMVAVGGDALLNGGTVSLGGYSNGAMTRLLIAGNLTLTNSAVLHVYSGPTNTTNYGALVSVTGDVVITSSWIYPYAHPVNGGAPLFRMADLTVRFGAGFNADTYYWKTRKYLTIRGYGIGLGPGKGYGSYDSGGGYGGKGGDSSTGQAGGNTYGSTNAPIGPGCGGGRTDSPGCGGGAVRIEAADVILDGTITANGSSTDGYDYQWGGGGSGGGIFIACDTFAGAATGVMRADGAAGSYGTGGIYPGAGGGGRIAVAVGLSDSDLQDLINGIEPTGLVVYLDHTGYDGKMSVTNGVAVGTGTNGAPGTKRFLAVSAGYSLTVSGNPADYGTPSPYDYGLATDIASGTWITNSVASPVDAVAGTRRASSGWYAEETDGTYAGDGTGTQAVFEVTTNMNLTHYWTNEYLLTIQLGPNGTATLSQAGWYTNGMQPTVSATGDTGYAFSQWTGDVSPGQATSNPLVLNMDQARTIMAQFASTSGEIKTWTGNGNWISDATNWSPSGAPGPLDWAIVKSGTAILDTATEARSVVVSNAATVVFTNWSTTLTASNITVQSGGTLKPAGPFANTAMSNRVQLVCSNLVIEAGGGIDADARGYIAQNGDGAPSGLDSTGPGAGHGGKGGDSDLSVQFGGVTYGSLTAPTAPGSGGGLEVSALKGGGAGGGAVRIVAGTVTLDGTITANGADHVGGATTYGGGGSGGSIFIDCGAYGGAASGLLRVNGGAAGSSTGKGGGGGGGRIALVYTNLLPGTATRVFANAGADARAFDAGVGTVYLSDNGLLAASMDKICSGQVVMDSVASWTTSSLTLTNGHVEFGNAAFDLTVSGNLAISNGAELSVGREAGPATTSTVEVGGNADLDNGTLTLGGAAHVAMPVMSVGGNLRLTNAAAIHVYSTSTNGVDYGALVSVMGDVSIVDDSWIFPYAHPTNGGAALFRMQDLVIESGGGFDADSYYWAARKHLTMRGYGISQGPGVGGGGVDSGGGYGGKGGDSSSGISGGVAYGSTNAPIGPGSGAGRPLDAGAGGGAIRIEAAQVTMDGTLKANGSDASGVTWGGGGAGGGIFVICASFSGQAGGLLQAEGGAGAPGNGSIYPGGGGGGRIAVWHGVPASEQAQILVGDLEKASVTNSLDTFLGTVSVANGTASGTGEDGEAGTVVFITFVPPRGTVFLVR